MLENLTFDQKKEYIIKLLQEQVLDQRVRLRFWRDLTKQPAQIDTGYIAQHLISLITSIPGGEMRGKGDDLSDGSEVKSANFLDSLDKRGAIAPRWNFQCNDQDSMESLLEYPKIYLVSLDLNTNNLFRARAWKLDPREHKVFNTRYKEWMELKGRPKLQNPNRPGVNFQLFPPKLKTNANFARHGCGKKDELPQLEIKLEDNNGSKKILHAEEDNNGKIQILHLDPN